MPTGNRQQALKQSSPVTQQTDDIEGFALPETDRDKAVGASHLKLQRVLACDTDMVRYVRNSTEEDVMENRLKQINKDENVPRLC